MGARTEPSRPHTRARATPRDARDAMARAATRTLGDALVALAWTSHVACGTLILFVLALALASALRVDVAVCLAPCAGVFWSLLVPSDALGRMRARGWRWRDVAAAAATRSGGGNAVAFWSARGDARARRDETASDAVGRESFGRTTAATRGRRALPPATTWPHRPIFVRASPRTKTTALDGWASERGPVLKSERGRGVKAPSAIDANAPVNTESAMEFETELFRGKIVCRFKGVEDAHTKTSSEFYRVKKCTFQVLVQGKFKEKVKVSDMLTGGEFDRAFENIPPRTLVFAGEQFFKLLTPGLSVDMLCDVPYYYAPLGSTLSVLAAHAEEDAPEPTAEIGEDTRRFGGRFATPKTIDERCAIFSDPSENEEYYFNTEDVYTMDYFQNVLLFDEYVLDVKVTQLPLARCLNGQPISFFGKHRDGRYAYSFEIWHECLLPKAPERTPIGTPWPQSDHRERPSPQQ